MRDLKARSRQEVEKGLALLPDDTNLPTLCRQFDFHLNQIIRAQILEDLGSSSNGRNGFCSSKDFFQYRKHAYDLEVGPSHQCRSLHSVVINALTSNEVSFKTTLRIDGFGRFKDSQLQVPLEFKAREEAIAIIVTTVLETGYRLLNDRILDKIEQIQPHPSHALYSLLRSLLGDDLSQHVKLNAIVDERGFYILDREAFSTAIQNTRRQRYVPDLSPFEVLTEVCVETLPLHEMFSKRALDRNLPVNADLWSAKYAPTGVHFREMALYGTDQVCVQPLVVDERTSLIAAYATNVRHEIEPILDPERPRFKTIVDRNSKGLREIFDHTARQARQPIEKTGRLVLDTAIYCVAELAKDFVGLRPGN